MQRESKKKKGGELLALVKSCCFLLSAVVGMSVACVDAMPANTQRITSISGN